MDELGTVQGWTEGQQSMAAMLRAGESGGKPEEGRALVGHGAKLGDYTHCPGEDGLLRLLGGASSIGGREWKLGDPLTRMVAGGDEKWMVQGGFERADGLDMRGEKRKGTKDG